MKYLVNKHRTLPNGINKSRGFIKIIAWVTVEPNILQGTPSSASVFLHEERWNRLLPFTCWRPGNFSMSKTTRVCRCMSQQLPETCETVREFLLSPVSVFIFLFSLSETQNSRVTWGGAGVTEPALGLIQLGVDGGQRSLHGFRVLRIETSVVIFAKREIPQHRVRQRSRESINVQEARECYDSLQGNLITPPFLFFCQNAASCMQICS